MSLLAKKNGFYAFEAALQVFCAGCNEGSVGLESWNAEAGWRRVYGDSVDGCVFFAQDVFGVQFCVRNDQVFSFDPEAATFDHLSETVEGWAHQLLEDPELLTGYPIAHAWQVEFGPLPAGMRLVPKIPFVAGGAFEPGNLFSMEAGRSMEMRGEFARQIKDLPDGATIEFQFVDD